MKSTLALVLTIAAPAFASDSMFMCRDEYVAKINQINRNRAWRNVGNGLTAGIFDREQGILDAFEALKASRHKRPADGPHERNPIDTIVERLGLADTDGNYEHVRMEIVELSEWADFCPFIGKSGNHRPVTLRQMTKIVRNSLDWTQVVLKRANELGVNEIAAGTNGSLIVAAASAPYLRTYDIKGKLVATSTVGHYIASLRSVPGGSIIFALQTNGVLRALDPALSEKASASIKCAEGEYDPITRHMDVDAKGNVYIYKRCHARNASRAAVDVFDPALHAVRSVPIAWNGGEFGTGPTAFAVNESGDAIFVANLHSIYKIDLATGETRKFNRDPVVYPLRLHSHGGLLYVVDHLFYMTDNLKVLSQDGAILRSYGDTDATSLLFKNPAEIAFAPDGAFVFDSAAAPFGVVFKVGQL